MKKVTKVFSVMVASVALAAMLSGCGGDKKPAGGDTIKVGGNLEMTGGSASFGISSKNAIELAFKNINDKGGINGKKLELVVADNKSEAAEATNAMQKLVSQDKVVAVIGPNLSSATIAAGAINNGSKVLDIAPMATNRGTVVAEESYLQKDTDFKATLTKIKAAAPDILYVPGYYQEVGMIVKQGREMGIEIPMAGGDGWDSAKLPEIAGKAALNNTYFSSLYSPDDDSALNKAFVSEYEKAYKVKPDVFAALAYDSALLVAEAIKNAGDTDPVKIAQSMAKINGFQGVSGTVTFDAQHNPVKSAVIIEHKDGAQTFRTKINP